MVLRKIIEVIRPTLNKEKIPQKGTYFESGKGNKYFIPPLQQGDKREKPAADDWNIIWDEEYEPYVFPSQLAVSSARPDIVIWSPSSRTCVIAELTVCWEENFHQAHERKRDKKDYVSLINQCKQNGWKTSFFPVEVGARGIVSDSLTVFLKFMGLSRKKARQEADRIGRTSLQASYTLWLSRNQEKFSRWTLVEPQTAARQEDLEGPTDTSTRAPADGKQTSCFPESHRKTRDRKATSQQHSQGISTRAPADGKQMSCFPESRLKTGDRKATSQHHSQVPQGLVNLGNTCFINSIAQCLMANVSLYTFASPPVVNALEDIQSTRGHTVRPTRLVRAVAVLSPSLSSGQQQDAAEALEVMLTYATHSPRRDQGEIANVITCTVCGSEIADSRPLAPPILRVPISADSLETCLANMLAPQALDGRRCGQCQASSSEISTKILASPQALAIQLLRFEQLGSQVVKNTSSVALSPMIRLNSDSWRITGIINHTGSVHHGHYTAFAHRSLRWFRCDDSRVAETSEEVALSSSKKSAYILFLGKY